MRIIKLSTKEFDTVDEVIAFFEEYLPKQNPLGKFRFPPGWMAKDGLDADEPILFSYQGRGYILPRRPVVAATTTTSIVSNTPHTLR